MSNFDPIPASIKQQLLTQLCERFEDAIFILDTNLRYLSVNATYEIMIGYNEEFLIGRPLGIYSAEFLSEEERTILKDITERLDNEGFYENDFSMATRYGQTLECHMTYRRLCVEQTVYHVGMVRDMSSVVKDRKQVAHLLNYDQLTGLPNRKVFLSQTSELLLESYQEVVIVRLNIDRYRNLASTLGTDSINILVKDFVKQVSKLEMSNLRCFSHFGGDDFALLFECSDANMVRNQLDSLMQMCERPYALVNDVIYLHISVGVSYFPDHGNQFSELLIKAEKALHYVKQNGGDDVCWYNETINEATTDSLQLEAELRVAINDCQFVPYYQPKVALDTGAITGFEALVRWQHPTRGLLRPIDFIDAIIKYKLSFELFYQMAVQIAQQLSIWQALEFTQHICINADAAEFSHSKFFSFINNLFTQHDIHAHQLHIEVTESSLMLRHANVKQQLTLLKELGVCLALDDFGTGYASLSYLQEYPFDFIKIDKSFISKIVTDRTQNAIVKTILDLANALDMQVVAEGIETEQQRDLLVQMGCTYGQGYWFSRPVTADEATEMLTQQYSSK
ncbi:putative bifunctional diguanylate cyclase/phosphodiesterase [Psychrobacter sp. LV10R520-6]|uniref:putative bifunctional diguanylate cyclase/phosphodiesterase n=1 Tax=Psychrobacter sp. LV10R520-6 TaxID=1415574 RepID=UPI0024C902CC|nr:GGDEF domain-containing phosphodiesterase [Psychrobacter sp. LV10R520-6]SNT69750.1 PAS domain S-box-containing protein/diguanylate cyclase (GGDEF) domain-containing protein [Psychrobacter sp. LV10R520-6]